MQRILQIIRNPAAAGVLLFISAILALLISNSAYGPEYLNYIYHDISIGYGNFQLTKPFELWVNEGLMALFFFHIGLELKLEFLDGTLKDPKAIFAPAVAAVGGMLIPAIIYTFIAQKYLAGWAIPTATDIAFAVGICSLVGQKVPKIFKIMLLSIAIFDDLGAVIIIAIFYSDNLSITALLYSSILISILYLINKFRVKHLFLYLFLGLVLWVAVVKSGVHATLSGFILALLLPNDKLKPLEHAIQPWVAYIVMPLFALVNAGVNFSNTSLLDLQHPITMGIFFGLALGKPIGIFMTGKIVMNKILNNAELLALGALCGVGFTMSLFIGTLAFTDVNTLSYVKIGVMLASLCMGIAGYSILKFTYKEA